MTACIWEGSRGGPAEISGFSWMWCHPTLPGWAGQASCLCKPGLVSIAHDSSAGCFAHCSAFSCDRSATCQVTPDGKTR